MKLTTPLATHIFGGQHGLCALTKRYPDERVAPGWRGPRFPLLSKFFDGTSRLLYPDRDF